jgi:RNA polymerase sigma-70 factor (ECF subfamily)
MSSNSDRGTLESALAEGQWLRGLALYLARDQADADDMVQETWVATLRASPERRASMRPWLAEVLRNVRWRGLRGAGRRRAREAGLAQLQEGDVAPSTETMLARLELARLVSETMRNLDEPYRTTLLLRFFEDRQPAEIARAQGVPAGTVRWRLSEGLRRVRARLDEVHGRNRETWRAILPLPAAAAAAPCLDAGTKARGWFRARTAAWLAGGALVPALVAGLLLGRPAGDPGGIGAAAPGDGERTERAETPELRNHRNGATTLFGVVLPALLASADAAGAPPGPPTASAGAPPICVPAAGCIERIPRSELPAPVESALLRAIAGREVHELKIQPGFEKGHSTYEVEFEVDGLGEELDFMADGTYLESEIDLRPGDLPPLIAAAVAATLPVGQVIKAELHDEAEISYHELENGVPKGPLRHRAASRFYELKVRSADGTRELEISEGGELLKNEPR